MQRTIGTRVLAMLQLSPLQSCCLRCEIAVNVRIDCWCFENFRVCLWHFGFPRDHNIELRTKQQKRIVVHRPCELCDQCKCGWSGSAMLPLIFVCFSALLHQQAQFITKNYDTASTGKITFKQGASHSVFWTQMHSFWNMSDERHLRDHAVQKRMLHSCTCLVESLGSHMVFHCSICSLIACLPQLLHKLALFFLQLTVALFSLCLHSLLNLFICCIVLFFCFTLKFIWLHCWHTPIEFA